VQGLQAKNYERGQNDWGLCDLRLVCREIDPDGFGETSEEFVQGTECTGSEVFDVSATCDPSSAMVGFSEIISGWYIDRLTLECAPLTNCVGELSACWEID